MTVLQLGMGGRSCTASYVTRYGAPVPRVFPRATSLLADYYTRYLSRYCARISLIWIISWGTAGLCHASVVLGSMGTTL